jgi:tetratricopeptide (TPR) repeat protein
MTGDLLFIGIMAILSIVAPFLYYLLAKKLPVLSIKERKELTPQRRKDILGRACHGLGSIYEYKGERGKAFEQYKKAKSLDAILTPDAIVLMGNIYAENKAKEKDAIDIYLEYIKIKSLEEKSRKKVYLILKEKCHINETKDDLYRKEAMKIARKVILVDPDTAWAHYCLGVGYVLEKELSSAVKSLAIALNLNKNHPMTYYWLGKAYSCRDDDNSDNVLTNYKKFLSFPFKKNTYKALKQGEAAFEIGKLLVNQIDGFETTEHLSTQKNRNELTEAISYFEKAVSLNDQAPTYSFILGRCYYGLGNDEKALFWFSRTLELDSSHSLSNLGFALINEKRGDLEGAINAYELVAENGSTSFPVDLKLGILHCRLAHYEKAMERLQKFKQSGEDSDSLLFYLGFAAQGCGEYETALNVWIELQARHPDDTKLQFNIADVHYLFGCNYLKDEKYKEAIPEWEKYLEMYNNDEETIKGLAQLYFRAGVTALLKKKSRDIKEIKTQFQKAYELDNSNSTYPYFIGLCDLGMDNYSDSRTQFDKLLKEKPDNLRVKYHRGLSLFKNGDKEEALKMFFELEDSKNKGIYSNYAAWVIANEQLKKGNFEEAISRLRRFI